MIFKPNLVPKTPHETYSETSDLDETLHGRSWRKNLEFETYRNRFNLDLTPVFDENWKFQKSKKYKNYKKYKIIINN